MFGIEVFLTDNLQAPGAGHSYNKATIKHLEI